MTVEEVEISILLPDPANVRRHTDAQVEKLMASLRRFGQQLPLLVRPDGTVLAGNARLEAMRRLGWEIVKIIRTDLDGVRATEYGIADNKLHDDSDFDPDGLAQLLAALQEQEGFDPAALGYTPDELAGLLTTADPIPAAPPDDFKEFGIDIETEHQCPKCGYRWSGSSAAPQQEAA